ncbi:16014_t:CDS:2, partial [Gigaspora margarita]
LFITTTEHCYDNNYDDYQNYFYYLPWNSKSSTLPIGPTFYESIPYDPQFVIRNDDADQYKKLIIINGELIFSHHAHICKSGILMFLICSYVLDLEGVFCRIVNDYTAQLLVTDMYSFLGDASGPVSSFAL